MVAMLKLLLVNNWQKAVMVLTRKDIEHCWSAFRVQSSMQTQSNVTLDDWFFEAVRTHKVVKKVTWIQTQHSQCSTPQ